MEETKEPEGGARELKQDSLVEKLVVDPTKSPDVQVLVGLLGRGSEARNWRLYFTPQLDNYVEFSRGDVLHTQQLDAARFPLGGTMIWLRRDAALKHTQTVTRQAQAEFVQGDIVSRFMTGSGMQEISPWELGQRTVNFPYTFPCTLFLTFGVGNNFWNCGSIWIC
jgi:hypothetical protein